MRPTVSSPPIECLLGARPRAGPGGRPRGTGGGGACGRRQMRGGEALTQPEGPEAEGGVFLAGAQLCKGPEVGMRPEVQGAAGQGAWWAPRAPLPVFVRLLRARRWLRRVGPPGPGLLAQLDHRQGRGRSWCVNLLIFMPILQTVTTRHGEVAGQPGAQLCPAPGPAGSEEGMEPGRGREERAPRTQEPGTRGARRQGLDVSPASVQMGEIESSGLPRRGSMSPQAPVPPGQC